MPHPTAAHGILSSSMASLRDEAQPVIFDRRRLTVRVPTLSMVHFQYHHLNRSLIHVVDMVGIPVRIDENWANMSEEIQYLTFDLPG